MARRRGGGGGEAGWYADPVGRYPQRFWDGTAWSASVLDTQGQIAVDYLGTPVEAPSPPTGGHPSAAGPRWRPSRRSIGWMAAAVVLAAVVLVAAVLISEQRASDDIDTAVASQAAEASDELSDSVGDISDSLSDLESQVSDLSDEFAFDFTDFSEFSEEEPPFEACDLVTPADIETVLAVAVTVDRYQSFEPFACTMVTPATPDGTAIFVYGDVLYDGDELEDLLDEDAPGGLDALTAIEVGDSGYVGTSYGLGFAAAAKGEGYVEIAVQKGGGSPSVEQLTELLKIAVSHM